MASSKARQGAELIDGLIVRATIELIDVSDPDVNDWVELGNRRASPSESLYLREPLGASETRPA